MLVDVVPSLMSTPVCKYKLSIYIVYCAYVTFVTTSDECKLVLCCFEVLISTGFRLSSSRLLKGKTLFNN
jgi:hypothetical protein